MERLHNTVSWVQAAVVGGIALSAHIVFDELREWLHAKVAASVALLLVAALVFKLAELGAEHLIAHSVTLRKLILCPHFIEGLWINTVQDPRSHGRVDSVGLMEVIFRDKRYVVSGESLGLNGAHLGNFKHESSQYSDYALRYAYAGINSRQGEALVEGFGEYLFTPTAGIPMSFDGFVQDTFFPHRMTVHGQRITDANWVANIDDLSVRKALIAHLLERVAPKSDA